MERENCNKIDTTPTSRVTQLPRSCPFISTLLNSLAENHDFSQPPEKWALNKKDERPTYLLEACSLAVYCDRFCRTGGL